MTKTAGLLSYGNCSNAGDVLIFDAFKKLFDNELQTTWHHVRSDSLNVRDRNVVIGPGGLLSGAYRPDVAPDELVIRHLTQQRLAAWRKQKRPVFAFGTGTNSSFDNASTSKPFSAEGTKIIKKLAEVSSGLYLRGSPDIRRLSALCSTEHVSKFKFQPCPSVFLDRLYNLTPSVTDQIVINFPLRSGLTKDNVDAHPLRRFRDYAKSLGLSVCLLDNHPADVSPYVTDVFDSPSSDPQQFDFIQQPKSDLSRAFEDRWTSQSCLASRFNGYRFAFGVRLHSFLPFMAFNTPSVLLAGSDIRSPMPFEYFRNQVYAAKVPFGRATLTDVVDGMIERLNYFIKHEDSLRQEVADERARLWQVTSRNKLEMLSMMN